jgi:FMN-dependent NADH-azoreductase
MTKTLLVSYTPRLESNTKKLVQTYLKAVSNKSEITHLDLVKEPAPLLLEDNLNALLKRDFMGIELTEKENISVQSTDRLVQQFVEADRIVIAFPMYNFSVPATVKAWLDAIIQKGKTFNITDEGLYVGLCQRKKALILMTTGGEFSQEPAKNMKSANNMNYATPLVKNCMGLMGIESHAITACGLNQHIDRVDDIIAKAQQEIIDYINEKSSW